MHACSLVVGDLGEDEGTSYAQTAPSLVKIRLTLARYATGSEASSSECFGLLSGNIYRVKWGFERSYNEGTRKRVSEC